MKIFVLLSILLASANAANMMNEGDQMKILPGYNFFIIIDK